MKIILLVSGFLLLIIISRKSIRSIRSHGLYRLIAWMGLWAIFLQNWRHWFRDPFSINQIISWVSLLISIILLIISVASLRQAGNPEKSRPDDTLFGIEKTTKLVTSGIYRYIRHPMYSSLLFLGLGIFFKAPSLWGVCILAFVIVFLLLTAHTEEKEDIQYFGDEYQAYQQRTKKFIPYAW